MTKRLASPKRIGQEHEDYHRGVHVGCDGEQLFSRVQAARFLVVHVSTIKRAEERGALRAVVIRGVHCYTRDELDRYRATTRFGETAAKAYTLLDQGKSPAALVKELEITPAIAQELAESYAQQNEGVLCVGPKGSRAAWEIAFGVQLRPELVLRALELAARTPSVRARLVVDPKDE